MQCAPSLKYSKKNHIRWSGISIRVAMLTTSRAILHALYMHGFEFFIRTFHTLQAQSIFQSKDLVFVILVVVVFFFLHINTNNKLEWHYACKRSTLYRSDNTGYAQMKIHIHFTSRCLWFCFHHTVPFVEWMFRISDYSFINAQQEIMQVRYSFSKYRIWLILLNCCSNYKRRNLKTRKEEFLTQECNKINPSLWVYINFSNSHARISDITIPLNWGP